MDPTQCINKTPNWNRQLCNLFVREKIHIKWLVKEVNVVYEVLGPYLFPSTVRYFEHGKNSGSWQVPVTSVLWQEVSFPSKKFEEDCALSLSFDCFKVFNPPLMGGSYHAHNTNKKRWAQERTWMETKHRSKCHSYAFSLSVTRLESFKFYLHVQLLNAKENVHLPMQVMANHHVSPNRSRRK